ncbi:ATP-binding cassette domain-containing protein [Paenibacillus sp. 1011MAR3C5]|uniref:ABC transporter ATP-binding protein n=1 Tax=Paenibacillus sp. 1011MAR3C5 TaxID=1675787 RepID=UPI002175DE3E|nr:ATP-binding cassette domain-containing protein [Paenibacillus sp. 1011MAR3C5]
MSALFEIRGLSKRIPSTYESSGERVLLNHIDAIIREPESIAIMGALGQGKSTMLRILACLDSADEGDMSIRGASCSSMEPAKWRRQVCYVAQHAVMLPGSVEDNLRTVSRLHGTAYEQSLAERLMERSGLAHLPMNGPAEELSGGEKQRLALIRALLLRPTVLLLDEVTASLDSISCRLVEDILIDWHSEEGLTLIWVTHQAEQASRVASRTWTLEDGRLTDSGRGLHGDSADDKVRDEAIGSVSER